MSVENEIKYVHWFSRIPHLSSKEKLRLLEIFADEETIFTMKENRLKQHPKVAQRTKEILLAARKDTEWEREYDRFCQSGIRLIAYQDAEYPKRLTHIYNPPYCLYVKGRPLSEERKCFAVVGARACSSYGAAVAKEIGRQLTRAGVDVVSGLAAGIDAAAHAGALEAMTAGRTLDERAPGTMTAEAGPGGGLTGDGLAEVGIPVAVLGCGVDICYPAANRLLYQKLARAGSLVSEFPPGCAPKKYHFPMRNRILSGLSDGVIVVEARERSGSLITADLSLEQGKAVYAVPGRISDSLSRGTNWLLSQGADVFCSVQEFLQEQGILQGENLAEGRKIEIPLEKNERLVYSVLDSTPKHFNFIVEETGLCLPQTAELLLRLRKRGCVQEIYQNYYIKISI